VFPDIHPNETFRIKVDHLHELYVEESGNPGGIPVVFLHGGPGAGTEHYHRRLFNPEKYRIILFDQRGCGQSTPHAELEGNTTQALVDDIEIIRQYLSIEQWVVFGGSWGSTLGLVYAQTYPSRVMGLIVRGIFMCRPKEIEWFYQSGASRIFTDYWQDFLAPIPQNEHHDLVNAYYKRLTGDDEVAQMACARAWSIWEGRTATLLSSKRVVQHFSDPFTALSVARIECHYFMNNSFLEPEQILRNTHRLIDIPGIIVQGRYDVICPFESAWELHQAWPQAEFCIVDDAGHAASDKGILEALIHATEKLAKQLE